MLTLTLAVLLAQSGTIQEISRHPPIDNRVSSPELDAARAKIAEWEAYAKALQTQMTALAQRYGQCSVSLVVTESGKIPPPPAPLPAAETPHPQVKE